MATKKTTIGRTPTFAGAWVNNYVNPKTGHNGYPLKKRVSHLGSEFQSLIEDNTYEPATLNQAHTEITFDTEHWEVVSNGSDAYLLQYTVENKMDEVDARLDEQDEKVEMLNGSDVVVGVRPVSGETNKIYRVPNDPTAGKYTDYGWNGTQFEPLCTYPNDVDDEPTAGSDNLVKSGGVQNELALGAVYDVSAKNPTAGPNNDGKWGSLSALLSDANLNTLVPTAVRKGGMSIKFVQSSDNKYVQFRYMGTTITGTPEPFLDVANWVSVAPPQNAANIRDIKTGGRYEDLVLANNQELRISLKNALDEQNKGFTEAVIIGDGTTACKDLPINIVQYDDTDIISGINDLYKSADINDFSIQNTYIKPDGDTASFANVSSTDYIEIPNGYLYAYLGVCLFAATSVCFYDSSKVKIAAFDSASNQKWINIPTGAKYYRACSLMVKNSFAEGLQKPLILLSKIGEKESVKDLSQRIVELYASYNKYWMRQRINSDSFSGYGYVNRSDGQVVEVPGSQTYRYTPLIEIDSIYSNIMCLYLNATASVSIAYYDSNEDFIGSDVNYGRKTTGISDFTLNIPFNAKYIRFSCSITDHSTDGNNVYQIKYPYVILCEDALGLSNNKELDKIKTNYQFKEIDFSSAQAGFYNKNNGELDTSDDDKGMRYINKVDIELYNKLYLTLSSYSDGCVVAEFDQGQNFIKSSLNEITSVVELSTPIIITLDSRTRFIGISSISGGQNTHNQQTLQSETYYDYLNKKAILFRDNNSLQEYSDYTPEKTIITEKDFTNPHSYIDTSGIYHSWDSACKSTGFINISAYNIIDIKRLSAAVALSLAFYSEANEESFLYSLSSSQISTSSGERKYEIEQNANFVRISNLFSAFGTTYGLKPYIEFYNEENAGTVVVKSPIVYDKSFFGDKNFALFDDFDYSQILCYGQSFADGGLSEPGGSTEVIPNAFMLGSNTRETSGSLSQLAVNGVREFPVIGCVNALANICNRTKPHKFIASTGGASGRCIAAISEGTSYFDDMVTMFSNIKNAVNAENKTVGLSAIIFLQGESDYSPNPVDAEIYTNNKNEYKAKLLKLKNDLQNLAVTTYGQSYKPLFFVYQTSGAWIRSDTGYSESDNVTCPISMAQFELAQENDDVILISPCYFMTLYNNNHPSINGYRWTGEMAAKAIIQSLNMGIRYSNTKIEKVSYVKDKVFVDCYCPVLPLQVRTLETAANTNYGFWIREDGIEVTINEVIINGSQIVLTLSKELSPNKTHEISYAGRYRGGRGNICDSDKWISTLNYLDDTNDHTIAQRPKNPDGTNIFGQKYPMFNYLGVYYGTF